MAMIEQTTLLFGNGRQEKKVDKKVEQVSLPLGNVRSLADEVRAVLFGSTTRFDPSFARWVREGLDDPRQIMYKMIRRMQSRVNSVEEILSLFDSFVRRQGFSGPIISRDWTGNGNKRTLSRSVERLIGHEKITSPNYCFIYPYGSETHRAIGECTMTNKGLNEELVRRLRDELMEISESPDSWLKHHELAYGLSRRLQEAIYPLFGSRIHRLPRQHPDPMAKFFWTKTLMTWATIAISGELDHLRRQLLCHEVPMMPITHGINGGVVDTIRVLVDGEPPKGRMFDKCAEIMFNLNRPTVGGIGAALQNAFPTRNIGFTSNDYKAQVGDATWSTAVIKEEEITRGPVPKHLNQMIGYMVLAPVACMLEQGGGDPDLVFENPLLTEGTIMYLFSWAVKKHKVILSPEEMREEFWCRYVRRMRHARINRDLRAIERIIAERTALFLQGKKTEARIFGKTSEQLSFQDIVERYRRYVDPATKIIEIVSERKRRTVVEGVVEEIVEPVLALDFDRLIRTPRITTSTHFSKKDGGPIKCLNPDHRERRSTTLFVNPNTGKFRCIRSNCGIFGKVVRSDRNGRPLPEIPILSANLPSISETQEIIHPPELLKILGHAGEEVREDFAGSRACHYAREKYLDPKVLDDSGVGFWSNYTIIKLLERGYNLDELEVAGLVRYSIGVPVGFLQEIVGPAKEESIKSLGREVVINGRPETFFPHNPFGEAVSFPLHFGTMPASMCFLRIDDKRLVHKKPYTGFHAGAFGMHWAYSKTKSVVVTHSILDALTIRMAFGRLAMALCGSGESATIRALAESGKEISIAYGNENERIMFFGKEVERGGKSWNTSGIAHRLNDAGVNGMKDFTKQVLQKHPRIQSFNSLNEWWIAEGHHEHKT